MPSLWQPEGRRSSIQIIADVLRLSRLEEVSKTEIMSTVNMSYIQIQKYLSWLVQLEMLNKTSSGNNLTGYRITQKGLKLLSTLENLKEMLRRKETANILQSPLYKRSNSTNMLTQDYSKIQTS
jgi:predicted transcriptional regulator